jgi:hypothetical protein
MTDVESCRVCGRRRDPTDPTALVWAVERDPDGRVHAICPDCTRRHARDIESGLPAEYW